MWRQLSPDFFPEIQIFSPKESTTTSILGVQFNKEKLIFIDFGDTWYGPRNCPINDFPNLKSLKLFVLLTHLHPDHWNAFDENTIKVLYVKKGVGIQDYYQFSFLQNQWEKLPSSVKFNPPRFENKPFFNNPTADPHLSDKHILDVNTLLSELKKTESNTVIETLPLESNSGHTNHDIFYKITIRKNGKKATILHIGDYYPSCFSLDDPKNSNLNHFKDVLNEIRIFIKNLIDNTKTPREKEIFLVVWSHNSRCPPNPDLKQYYLDDLEGHFTDDLTTALNIIEKAHDAIDIQARKLALMDQDERMEFLNNLGNSTDNVCKLLLIQYQIINSQLEDN